MTRRSAGSSPGRRLNDPKLASNCWGNWRLKDPDERDPCDCHCPVMKPRNRREAVLAALREHLGEHRRREPSGTRSGGKALEMFARTADKEGFESLTNWMAEAEFTPRRRNNLQVGSAISRPRRTPGGGSSGWRETCPRRRWPDPVREFVGEWTQQDYLAAGKWLSAAAEGPAKTAAVEAYAEAVAEYEPQVAAQWALTLPAGTCARCHAGRRSIRIGRPVIPKERPHLPASMGWSEWLSRNQAQVWRKREFRR